MKNRDKTKLFSQLKNFVENLPAAVAMFDRELNYLSCSKRWLRDYNLEGMDLIGKNHYEVFPEISEEWKQIHQQALKGSPKNSEEDSFFNQTKTAWLKWDVRPWYDEQGEIGGIVMLTEVLTEQKNKQLELDFVLKNLEVGVWKLNPMTKEIVCDEMMKSLYEVDELTMENFRTKIHPEFREKVMAEFTQALESQDIYEAIFPIQSREGKVKYIGAKAKIERNQKGEAISLLGINSDKTKEVEAKKEMENLNQYLDLALEGANLGIWDWWLESNKVQFDQRWGEMLGIKFEDLEMKLDTWQSRVHPDDLEPCFADIKAYISGETEQYQNIHRMKHADGHWVYILDQGKISERDEKGNPIRFTGTHLDITLQKKQEEQLISAMRKAETAEKIKSEFLANMSHEIRSPMNGVLGMLEVLSNTDLSPEQKDILEIIKSSGEVLLTVINDILDLSKIEAGGLVLDPIEFDISKAIREVIKLYTPMIDKKNLEFKFEDNLGSRSQYWGDIIRVKQIVTNLISNAIKFTSKGEVKVKLEILGESESGVKLLLSVSDSGIGIPKNVQDKMFKAFSQADSSITREYGGTGLGLTICKYLAEMMNGRISFKSEFGEGSIFYVEFVLNEAETFTDKTKLLRSKVSGKEFAENYPHKILLVEDNEINQKVASSFLKMLGYNCDFASHGIEAINKIENNGPYSLIFMDLQMPVMDGLTATKKILEKYSGEEMNIVAMTANAFESDRERCLKAGMVDYISKPINKDKLQDILYSYSKINLKNNVG